MMNKFIKQIYKKGNASSKKTVFIDRDGTLNKEVEYLSDEKEIELIPGVLEGLKKLNKKNMIIVVISNQPVIARGLAKIEDVKSINNTLVGLLNKNGIYVNAIYFCPHHPEKNHLDIPDFAMKYRIECKCRKPRLEMFKEAVRDFNIDLKSSYIVGDQTRDIKAGKDLGVKTILVKTGYKGEDETYPISPNFVCNNLDQAADIIIKS